jgi:hypothetical protein
MTVREDGLVVLHVYNIHPHRHSRGDRPLLVLQGSMRDARVAVRDAVAEADRLGDARGQIGEFFKGEPVGCARRGGGGGEDGGELGAQGAQD